MSRDASGNYTAPPSSFNPAVPFSTISTTAWNALLADIVAALTDSLSRSGNGGMLSALAMGSNKITGLASGVDPNDAVRLGQLGALALLGSGTGLSVGGGNLNISTVPVANGGTGLTGYATGDLLYASSSTTLARLPVGTNGQFLSISAGVPAWSSGAGTGDVVGPASATDNAAARFDATTGKLIQNSALLVADTTGALSRSGGGGIPVQGTNTNDAAGSGYVGEVIQAARLAGSAIVLTSNSVADVTSISLSAGDWDIQGQVAFSFAGTTTYTQALSWTSTTSATLPSADSIAAPFHRVDVSSHAPGSIDLPVPTGTGRLTLSSTTTVYLSCRATFATAGLNAYGFIWARRAR